jgi:class 3 adenylate cyclase/tetratricopeptide (TPR) repeat protein
MTCPRCQKENPGDAVFCQECGTRLETGCPSCGTANQLGAKFCKKCGQRLSGPQAEPAMPGPRLGPPASYTPKHLAERILTSRAALEGERKQVTVLFADVKGSMELLADRDPEEARKLLDPVLERMMEAVHRYEGTVNQVMGDGIMALFGAPVAHEDHAVRGCYAALRMQESVGEYAKRVLRSDGIPIQIRIGLNSGEVVVRSIGSDLHMDYTAIGQTPHLAARAEQLAVPGTILLMAQTLRLAEGFVHAKSLGPVPIKGVAAPVEVFQLIGARTKARLQVVASGLTPFVGRQAELGVLGRALDTVNAGHGQVVGISGEPGVGKTRLLYEFIHSLDTQQWQILTTSSVSYGKTTPYLPVIDILKTLVRVEDRDDKREIRRKITTKVLGVDAGLQPVLPALFALLDVPVVDAERRIVDPPQSRQQTVDALNRLLSRLASIQPVCLVVENLHWIDSATQEWLDSLVESLPGVRLLLLVTYRPEYQHGWGAKAYYTRLQLDSLPPERAGELYRALLGDAPSLRPLRQLLIGHTEGNPFFLEEIARTLVERKILDGEPGSYRLAQPALAIQVPATVQAVIAARIDRLSLEDKHLLQAASVIGRSLPFALLLRIAEMPSDAVRDRLAHLQSAEFLYETSVFPDTEYTFKHALTHEVAYGSLLLERRRHLHARIVDAIEQVYADRLDEHVERLAHHAVRGEIGERAVDYLRKAGTKAYTRAALSESRDRYQQGLDLLARLPATPENIRRGIDVRLDLHGPLVGLAELSRVVELHQEAEGLARQLQDRPRLGRVASRMGNFAWLDAGYSTAIMRAEEALQIVAAIDDPNAQIAARDVQITATHVLGLTYLALGQFRACVEVLRQNVEGPDASLAHERIGFTIPPYIFGCGLLAWGYSVLGDFPTALTYGQQGIDAAEASGYFPAQAAAHLYQATALVSRGEFGAALPLCARGVRLSELGAVGFWRAFAYSMLGWVLARSGEADRGLPHLERGAVLQESSGIKAIRSVFWTRWAEGLLLDGNLLEAKRVGLRGLELAEVSGERGFEAEACHVLARAVAEGGDSELDAACLHYERASTLAAELGMGPLVAHCHFGLGKLYRRTGDAAKAGRHLTTATAMYREMGMTFWLEKADAELRGVER